MDVSQALSALPALRSHAEGCEGLLTDRLALSTSSSCDSITIGVAAVVNGTAVSLAAAQSNARARACRANKHLETQCDDMDGVVKILESMVRHFEIKGVCCEEWPSVQDSMLNAGEILRSLDALPLSSSTITVREIRKDVVVRKVQGMSRFHLGVDVTRSRVHVPPLLQRGDVAGVSVTCLDGCGDTVLGLSPSDVAQRFVVSKACGEKARGWAVVKGGVSVRGNVVSLSIAMAIDCVGTALLQLVIGGARFPIPLQVRARLALYVTVFGRGLIMISFWTTINVGIS